jgi:hypothetical protein
MIHPYLGFDQIVISRGILEKMKILVFGPKWYGVEDQIIEIGFIYCTPFLLFGLL